MLGDASAARTFHVELGERPVQQRLVRAIRLLLAPVGENRDAARWPVDVAVVAELVPQEGRVVLAEARQPAAAGVTQNVVDLRQAGWQIRVRVSAGSESRSWSGSRKSWHHCG